MELLLLIILLILAVGIFTGVSSFVEGLSDNSVNYIYYAEDEEVVELLEEQNRLLKKISRKV